MEPPALSPSRFVGQSLPLRFLPWMLVLVGVGTTLPAGAARWSA